MSKAKKPRLSQEKKDGQRKEWPGVIKEVYPKPFITRPEQPKEKKPGQLTETQLKQYFEEVRQWLS